MIRSKYKFLFARQNGKLDTKRIKKQKLENIKRKRKKEETQNARKSKK